MCLRIIKYGEFFLAFRNLVTTSWFHLLRISPPPAGDLSISFRVHNFLSEENGKLLYRISNF